MKSNKSFSLVLQDKFLQMMQGLGYVLYVSIFILQSSATSYLWIKQNYLMKRNYEIELFCGNDQKSFPLDYVPLYCAKCNELFLKEIPYHVLHSKYFLHNKIIFTSLSGDVTIDCPEDATRYQNKIEDSLQSKLGFQLKTGDSILTHFDSISLQSGRKRNRRKSKVFERYI